MPRYYSTEKLEIKPDQEALLRANYNKMNNDQLAVLLKVSPSKIYGWIVDLKLGPRVKGFKSRDTNTDYYFSWDTAQQTDFILYNQ